MERFSQKHMMPEDNSFPRMVAGVSGGTDAKAEVRVGPRERIILTAIIEQYIATGEPVASQAIARLLNKDGMSPATIRNVMADLAEAGLLEQPHTSAGRIPTAKAFRYHVEQLTGRNRLTPGTLTVEHREQIKENFAGVGSAAEFLERTSHVLAVMSSGVGVAVMATGEKNSLEHVHFSRLAAGKVLAVMVTTSGAVMDRVLLLQHDVTLAELEAAAQYLNVNFYGWTLDRVRTELGRRIEEEQSEYRRVLESVEQLWSKSGMDRSSPGSSVFVVGVGNLIGSEADRSERDRERLRHILSALEEKQRLVELLNAYVDARQESVRVVVGLEDAVPEMSNLVLVGAPARIAGERMGTVAVIGSTRMQYDNTIQMVSYIAQLFNRMLEKS